MTVTVQIEPIETKTENGTKARVTGIDLSSGYPFHGKIEYETGEWQPARWRPNGNMSNGPVAWNLVMQNSDMRLLYEAAKKLNAELV